MVLDLLSALGALVGLLAFAPLLLPLAALRSREKSPSMLKGFLALGVSFVILTASVLVTYLVVGAGVVPFALGLVGGFVLCWAVLAVWALRAW